MEFFSLEFWPYCFQPSLPDVRETSVFPLCSTSESQHPAVTHDRTRREILQKTYLRIHYGTRAQNRLFLPMRTDFEKWEVSLFLLNIGRLTSDWVPRCPQ
jgi:hypothetical protein